MGLRNLNQASGNYPNLEYALYFNDGSIEVFELGNGRGAKTNYSKGTAYDFRIETKPALIKGDAETPKHQLPNSKIFFS